MQEVGTIRGGGGVADWISNYNLGQNIQYLLYSGCASSLYTILVTNMFRTDAIHSR
jgi:hypothetical protein